MKKMKKSEKVLRSLLICAMGLLLTGVTLSKVYATYYWIDVEHIFVDYNNGEKIPEGFVQETPRDDLIDDLGGRDLDVVVSYAPEDITIGASGSETGNNVGMTEALDMAEQLLGDEEKLQKLETIKEQYNKVPDPDTTEKWKDKIPEKPDYEYRPEVTEPQKPTVPEELPEWEDGMDEAQYKEACIEYLKEHPEIDQGAFNEKLEEYTKAVKDYGDDQKDYEEYLAWCEEHDPEEWATWNAYQKDKESYLQNLEEASQALRNLLGTTGIDMTDKDLRESYENAYQAVFNKIMELMASGEDFDISAIEGAFAGQYEELEDVEINTWQTAQEKHESDKAVNLFEFQAWLDESTKATLANADYTSQDSATKITVVCVRYDDNGEKTGPEQKYVSINGGKDWYPIDSISGNAEDGFKVEAGATAANTAQILEDGFVTEAITFTFVHRWTPDTGDSSGGNEGFTVEVTPPVETTPPPTPEPTPDPEEDLEEPEVPLAEVDEPEVPLSDIPQTGDISILWYCAALASAAGLLVLALQDRRNRMGA